MKSVPVLPRKNGDNGLDLHGSKSKDKPKMDKTVGRTNERSSAVCAFTLIRVTQCPIKPGGVVPGRQVPYLPVPRYVRTGTCLQSRFSQHLVLPYCGTQGPQVGKLGSFHDDDCIVFSSWCPKEAATRQRKLWVSRL
jgi:hypothetical protein